MLLEGKPLSWCCNVAWAQLYSMVCRSAEPNLQTPSSKDRLDKGRTFKKPVYFPFNFSDLKEEEKKEKRHTATNNLFRKVVEKIEWLENQNI